MNGLVPSYRGRLAPSPTGYLHLGHARTFWTAQERARKNSGVLVLRNDDLDTVRCKPEFVAVMIEDLRWFGFDWQEGPDYGGAFGPYAQSERYPLYAAALEKLALGGFIYPCKCSRKDLQSAATAPHAADDELIYPGICRPKSPGPAAPLTPSLSPSDGERVAESRTLPIERVPPTVGGAIFSLAPSEGERAGVRGDTNPLFTTRSKTNWRFQVPDGETISFTDGHFGPQEFVAGRDFGDFVIWRHDGIPSYQLATVVDDAAMRITEVVRGADLLLSTARQILIYRALGLTPPAFYHCPLMLDDSGQRLAKRNDSFSLKTLRSQGIKPVTLYDEWDGMA